MADAQMVEILSSGGSRTLAIDVGGTGIKAAIIDDAGKLLVERVRIDTPVGAAPETIIEVLALLVAPLGAYDRVSIGFPGVVRDGRVLTAPNLGNTRWKGYDLADALGKALGKTGAGSQRCRPAGTGGHRRQGRGNGHHARHRLRHGSVCRWPAGAAPRTLSSSLPQRRDLRSATRQRRPQGDRWRAMEQARAEGDRQSSNADELSTTCISAAATPKSSTSSRRLTLTVVSNEAGLRGGVALWQTDRKPAQAS